ncbi:MAG: YebC/PmpR family DNA-binding transcriptional regulator [Spirochaetaceae bacterium]|nr:YebC/PmpR family DNA-binding transcriptional regulator [Spirochaetaceae bacterium]
MSGHSKWHSIRHKKGATDAKRGKIFTKLIREITVAARLGGGDPDANPRLRTVMLKAREANMPRDNIDRAIKKGSGGGEGSDFHELLYEAYGPGGVALLIQVLTDNKNRSAAEIRNILTKGGGNLGETGSVSYLFSRKGVIAFEAERYNEDQVMEVVLEGGAEDVSSDTDTVEVLTGPEDFHAMLDVVERAGLEHRMAEISWVPDASMPLDEGKAGSAMRLIEALEDHDDVQQVSTNMEAPEPVAADIG